MDDMLIPDYSKLSAVELNTLIKDSLRTIAHVQRKLNSLNPGLYTPLSVDGIQLIESLRDHLINCVNAMRSELHKKTERN